MTNRKIYKTISAICMAGALMLGGCGAFGAQEIGDKEMFSDRDFETDYDENKSTRITLKGDSAECSGSGAEISGSTVTIREEGTYILTGFLEDGMIVVDGDKEEKIQLVLDGVNIHSQTCAPIYILQSDKVFITLAEDSKNILSNGGSFVAIDENEIDAVIFSKEDLTINGEGALAITSPAGHGVVSKDELTVTGGSFDISCSSHGLSGKDGIGIANGTFHIVSGKDGIHSDASIVVNNGSFAIATGDDGFHADDTLTVNGGAIDISTSYEGMEALHVVVAGGDISLVAEDDGLNAAGGADSSGFGGMGGNDMFGRGDGRQHGEKPQSMPEMPEKPEGMPHMSEMPEKPEGMPQMPEMPEFDGEMPGNPFSSSHSSGSITISGGNLFINASGDGIDANGTLTISGGKVVINSPTHGDTATLDYDISGVIEGGTFIGTGARTMAQTFSASPQAVISVNAGNITAGTKLILADKAGKELLTCTPVHDYSIVILSSPDLISGETYTLTAGSQTMECTAQ